MNTVYCFMLNLKDETSLGHLTDLLAHWNMRLVASDIPGWLQTSCIICEGDDTVTQLEEIFHDLDYLYASGVMLRRMHDDHTELNDGEIDEAISHHRQLLIVEYYGTQHETGQVECIDWRHTLSEIRERLFQRMERGDRIAFEVDTL